jgi:hypothetical protein
MIEAIQKPHPAARKEPAMKSVSEPVYVEEWKGKQEAVCPTDLPASIQVNCIRSEVIVCKNCALGSSRCPGRIDDCRRIVTIQSRRCNIRRRSGRLRCKLHYLPRFGLGWQLAVDDHSFWFAIPQDVLDLAFLVEDIDGYKDDAQPDAGQIQIDHLDAIRKVYTHTIASREPSLCEHSCHLPAATSHIVEGEDYQRSSAIEILECHVMRTLLKRKIE